MMISAALPRARLRSGIRRLSWIAAAFAVVVIVFGAFVRLSNAGLSCPDWPTCYGQATWPTQSHEISAANIAYPERPVESDKAWREQTHRILVGGLALTTFALAIWMFRRRRELGGLSGVAVGAAFFIFFQAALGMWTVTLKLLPIVVMAHLLGGMALFALLAYIALRLSIPAVGDQKTAGLRRMAIAGIVLVTIQIALGGWTSANYAALACGTDFPTCLGQWWPATDFHQAFVLWRGIGVNYEGGVLDAPARSAIQIAHRIGAVVVFGHVLALAILALRRRALRGFAFALAAALGLQICLGIGNVVMGLPLPMATAHNATATLLLFALLALVVRLRTSTA